METGHMLRKAEMLLTYMSDLLSGNLPVGFFGFSMYFLLWCNGKGEEEPKTSGRGLTGREWVDRGSMCVCVRSFIRSFCWYLGGSSQVQLPSLPFFPTNLYSYNLD